VPRAAGKSDLSGWVVAILFMLFIISVAVYRVASVDFPALEASAESSGVPLPAGPRHPEPVLTR
jgi:hypothetical protein